MALKELNINPVIDIVNSVVEKNQDLVKGTKTEQDMLEVRVGLNVHDISGPHLEPFGRVTMEVPSSYLVVRTQPNGYGGTCRPEQEKLMRDIAETLSSQYDVVYVYALTPEHGPKKRKSLPDFERDV